MLKCFLYLLLRRLKQTLVPKDLPLFFFLFKYIVFVRILDPIGFNITDLNRLQGVVGFSLRYIKIIFYTYFLKGFVVLVV
jgi:hypothetical protein